MAERIGLIGVGLLGSALGERFLAAGFEVSAFDVAESALRGFAGLGGQPASSAAEVAALARRIVLCLPHSQVTAAVLQEVAPRLAPAHLVIDVTTGEPDEMAAFAARLAEQGVAYVDACVAGSSRQVRHGEVVVMAGSTARDFARCEDLFRCFAPRAFHVGPPGSGARMKLVVNLVLGLNRAVLAEGLAFAAACGVDAALALQVLQAGPAYSRVMDVKGTKMLDRDYAPEARLRQHHKDVRLILTEGAKYGARLPLSALHDQLLTLAEEAGFSEADNAAIAEVFRR